MTIPQEIDFDEEKKALAKIIPNLTPLTPTPTKADIILKIIEEIKRLEQYRQDLLDGKRRPSNLMKAVFYVTQLIIQANKVILDAMKENIQITAGNVDITTQINELIKISREPTCNNSEPTPPS